MLVYKFKCFAYPALLSCVSHATDICTAAIENISMYAVSTNQLASNLHSNDKASYPWSLSVVGGDHLVSSKVVKNAIIV